MGGQCLDTEALVTPHQRSFQMIPQVCRALRKDRALQILSRNRGSGTCLFLRPPPRIPSLFGAGGGRAETGGQAVISGRDWRAPVRRQARWMDGWMDGPRLPEAHVGSGHVGAPGPAEKFV